MTLGQRFARFVTAAVVRVPRLWPLFRVPLRAMFDRIAPTWNERRTRGHLAPFETALARISPPPRRALDVGTGTGAAALAIARRFPGAEVVGVDVSSQMVEEARVGLPSDLAGRVVFETADGARLPYADGSFDLVALANMIPFFDEIRRVLRPGGHVVLSFSLGPETPIYVPPERLRSELEQRGFGDVEDLVAGPGTALVARRRAT